MKYLKPRGTADVYGNEAKIFKKIENIVLETGKLNGFSEIKTPIFESANLFIRSIGETSDIVKKEFYIFKDKSDRELALRPENTAGVVRAVVEEKMLNKIPTPIKLMYVGPMFRYERPQSGRYRQFDQFGCEIIGTESIYDDVDCLVLGTQILDTIGIKNYTLSINNIGNFETRKKWVDALKKYLSKYKNELSDLSKERLISNPLRILDDKVDGKKGFIKNAPKIIDFLSDDEKNKQKILEESLKKLKIKFIVDEKLVRGLDYYTNLVFEFNVDNSSAILAGGRYGKLMKEIGGPDVGCIGFAMGMQRIMLLLEEQNKKIIDDQDIDVLLLLLDEKYAIESLNLLKELRENGISAICKFDQNKIEKGFSYAKLVNAKSVILLGKNEINSGKYTIKNQKNMKQEKIDKKNIIKYISDKIKK
ncbi:MAG: histidine--tRNA ligase [Mycoplasmataceae bacterium]|nr:histidine--tRNA ligase [Mycoplasmataceae bacterium]